MDAIGSTNLEAIIEQQIREKDDISDIRTTLQQLVELNIDTYFCITLVPKLLDLASDTNSRQLNEYSSTINDLFQFLSSANPFHARSFFSQCLQSCQDASCNTRPQPSQTQPHLPTNSALQTLMILTFALADMITSGSLVYHDLYLRTWNLLPDIIGLLSIPAFLYSQGLQESTAKLFEVFNHHSEGHELCSLQIEALLIGLLRGIKTCATIPSYTMTWSHTILHLVQPNNSFRINNFSAISEALAALALSSHELSPISHHAIQRVACTLLQNHVDLPWFDFYVDQVNPSEDSVALFLSQTLRKDLIALEDDDEKISQFSLPVSSQYAEMEPSQPTQKPLHRDNDVFSNTKNQLMALSQEKVKQFISVTDSEEATEWSAQIREIASYLGMPLAILLKPFDCQLAELVIKNLTLNPTISESVAALYDQKLAHYLQLHMRYIASHIICMDNDDAFHAIATYIGLSNKEFCEKYAHYIFVDLLMNEENMMDLYMKRLQRISSEDPHKLLLAHKTKVTCLLALELGWPEKNQTTIRAFEILQQWTDDHSIPLSQYLSVYMLGILDKIGRFISDVRSAKQNPSCPQALEALNVIISILGENIKSHVLQLMTTLQTVGELPNMLGKCITLWGTLIRTMDAVELSANMGSIVRGLVGLMPRAEKQDRQRIAMEIHDLVSSDHLLSNASLEQIPDLPGFDELSHIRSLIAEKRQHQVKPTIDSVLQHFPNGDTTETLAALGELYQLLQHGGGLQEGVLSRKNEMYSVLLYLSRKRVAKDEVRFMAARCLGLLGAADPSRLDVKIVDESIVVLDNFEDVSENRNFICDLITYQLVPAFQAANNERMHQYLQYTMQTLLRMSGFSYAAIYSNTDKLALERWKQLPSAVQSILTPLLRSSFECICEIAIPEYPIHVNAQGYSEWIKAWFYRLVESCTPNAKTIFSACIPVIKLGNPGLVIYLLPYILLHVLLSGSDSDVENITNEMIGILKLNAQPEAQGEKSTQSYLQVVVSVTEYCRQWIRRKQRSGDKRQEKTLDKCQDTTISRVRCFLANIPNDLMAMASVRSKAYAQALLHMELHFRSTLEQHNSITPQNLENFQRVYAQMNDPDGMSAIFSLFQKTLTIDEEILQFECMNRWEDAKIGYEETLKRYPKDLQRYGNYFHCLRNQNNFGTMLDTATKLSGELPSWFSKFNAYRAEAAWKTGDWQVLQQATSLPMENTFNARIASALANIRKRDYLALHVDLQQAREDQIEYLSTTSMESYSRSHECIFRLQLIQELEDSQLAWESALEANQPDPLKDLAQLWKEQFRFISPSYQIQKQLLDLRRTTLFEIRQENTCPFNNINDGSFWVQTAKMARKAGDFSTAFRAILNAEAFGNENAIIERAKWYWKTNQTSKAVQYLQARANLDIKSLLLLAKYLEDIGTQDRAAVALQYRQMIKMNPSWEKAYYAVGRFYDGVATSGEVKEMSVKHFRLIQFVASNYCKALRLGSKYYYYTMPRLLTIWLHFGDQFQNNEITDEKVKHIVEQGHEKMCRMMEDANETIRPYQFGLILPRLISRLSCESDDISRVIMAIISKVLMAYPRNMIWSLIAPSESKIVNLRKRCQTIIEFAGSKVPLVQVIARHARDFTRNLLALALEKHSPDQPSASMSLRRVPGLSRMKDLELCIPKETALLPTLPEDSTVEHYPFPDDLPTITGIDDHVEVMRSLQQPKKITLLGSDGKHYRFLCKRNDDLRKDARMMEFSCMINTFLKKNPESRQRQLYIRTYAVIPLGENWGLIEWINNLNPLKTIVSAEWAARGISVRSMSGKAKQALENRTDDQKEKIFNDEILPQCPAVFYRWFLDNFPEPSDWFASRTRYTRTLAVMSIVGYILGLGDRHAENILFDQTNGDCVHVDVNMLFDKGQALQVPEIVPFRLTQNLTDAMGIMRFEGTFRKACEVTLGVLRTNKVQLLSVFETFVHDPLTEWQRRNHVPVPNSSVDAHALSRVQDMAKRQMDRIGNKIDSGHLIEDDVNRLIMEATNNRNLAQMFIGWAPFI